MSVYELGLLGKTTDKILNALRASLEDCIKDFDLVLGKDVEIRIGADFDNRDKGAAAAVAYFGNRQKVHSEQVELAVRANIPIIPVLPASGDWDASLPSGLLKLNGVRTRADDPKLQELACALLECVGLLRQQRRVFVSYRRIEARNAAVQLHDLLSSRGFEVFLDTHDIRPGEPFQDVLWHRLCDSDVMVMLDTPTYFKSKWTRQELGRARAKEIHVLRIVWPDHKPNRNTDLAETIYLDPHELSGGDGPIIDATAEQIVLAIERLRSRSIASRYMSITGKFTAEVRKIGGAVLGVGAHRAIAVTLFDDTKIWAYPVVGIPTADLLNDIADKATRAEHTGVPVLVYDHLGIRDKWQAHLKWLDQNIDTVKALSVADAGWTLAAWEPSK